MPARCVVGHVHDSFSSELASAARFRTAVMQAAHHSSGMLTPTQVSYAIEMSFLRAFMGWEEFLQQTFIRYMCGAQYCSGGAPTLISASPAPNLSQADAALRQGRRYIGWTVSATVIDRARKQFNGGEPYASAVGGIAPTLDTARRIRNRIVHQSDQCKEKYREALRTLFGTTELRGLPPGRALLKPLRVTTSGAYDFLAEFHISTAAAARLIVEI